jgi:hypothetical protein
MLGFGKLSAKLLRLQIEIVSLVGGIASTLVHGDGSRMPFVSPGTTMKGLQETLAPHPLKMLDRISPGPLVHRIQITHP